MIWNRLLRPIRFDLWLTGVMSVGYLVLPSAPVMAAIPGQCVAPAQVWAEGMTAALASYANREFRRGGVGTHISVVGIPEVVPLEGEEQLWWGIESGGDEMVVVYFSTRERSQGTVSGDESLERAYALFLARPRESMEPWQTISVRVTQSGQALGGQALGGQALGSQASGGGLLAPINVSRGPIALAIDAWQESGCSGLDALRISEPEGEL